MFRLCKTILVALTLFIGSSAGAGDAKVYPAAGCKFTGGGGRVLHELDGIVNTSWSGNGTIVHCPAINDSTGKGIRSVQVRVRGKVACHISRLSQDGTAEISSGYSNLSGTSMIEIAGVSYSGGFDSYDLYCILQGGQKLFSYRVDEY
jgi:hypothetical protein